MRGDEFTRFCDHCAKNVYNLSALTADAAISLIREKEGNLCGRFFRRADGTMLTADCPVGVHHRLRRKRKLAVLAASVFSVLGFSGCAKFDDASNTTTAEPVANQQNTNVGHPALPANQPQMPPAIAGGICAPPELLKGPTPVQAPNFPLTQGRIKASDGRGLPQEYIDRFKTETQEVLPPPREVQGR